LPGWWGSSARSLSLRNWLPPLLGLASDAMSPRWLMTAGAAVGAVVPLLFGLTHSTSIFFASRILEGLSAAAVFPALLAYLTVETEGDSKLRVSHELL